MTKKIRELFESVFPLGCEVYESLEELQCNYGGRLRAVTEDVCLWQLESPDVYCWTACQCEYSINRLRRLFNTNRNLDQARLRTHKEWVKSRVKAKAKAVTWTTSTRKRFSVPYNESPDRWFKCKNCGGVFRGHAILEGINYRIDDDCGGTAEDLVWIKDREELTEMEE